MGARPPAQGSAEKVAFVTDELGFDTAFNYREGPVIEQLQAAVLRRPPSHKRANSDETMAPVDGFNPAMGLAAPHRHDPAMRFGRFAVDMTAVRGVDRPAGYPGLRGWIRHRAKLVGLLTNLKCQIHAPAGRSRRR